MKLRSNGQTMAGRAVWDPLLVFCRLKAMAEITARCRLNGRDVPGGYKSCMPEIVREIGKGEYAAARPLSPPVPTAAEISLRDETVMWLASLAPGDRVILWGYAVGQSSRAIEAVLRRFGIGLSYRHVQRRFLQLLDELARYWQAARRPVDDLTLDMARRQVALVPADPPRTASVGGITSWRQDGAHSPVGDDRVIMVEMPRPRYRERAAGNRRVAMSQIQG